MDMFSPDGSKKASCKAIALCLYPFPDSRVMQGAETPTEMGASSEVGKKPFPSDQNA